LILQGIVAHNVRRYRADAYLKQRFSSPQRPILDSVSSNLI